MHDPPSPAGWQSSGVDSEPDLERLFQSLFEAMLGRVPARHETNRLVQWIRSGVPLTEIVDWFSRSVEYKTHIVSAVEKLEILSANPIDFRLSAAERNSLWAHISEIWSRVGTEDPFWSVLTLDMYRKRRMFRADQIDGFYETGRAEVARLESYLTRNGRVVPPEGVCVDYGCGVGRVTLWLARRFQHVVALDVSQPHLEMARRYLGARGITNVEYRLVRRPQDLNIMHGMNLFYSIMALQHNPPPLISEILSVALAHLDDEGTAFFQVPTHAKDYSWSYRDYVGDLMTQKRMELHVLPQWKIYQLIDAAGCKMLEVQPNSLVKIGVPHWISNTFMCGKSNSSARG
jgi:SAM-dependent methyltransferase